MLNLIDFSDLVYRVLRRVVRKAADLEAHRVGQKKEGFMTEIRGLPCGH